MKDQQQLLIRCDSDAKILEVPGRTGAFQLVQFITGHAMTSAVNGMYLLGPGDLFFISPEEVRFWKVSAHATVHYCAIWPEYLRFTDHVSRSLEELNVFRGQPAMTAIDQWHRNAIDSLFRAIGAEAAGTFYDKDQAIILYLQMMILYIKRLAERPRCEPVKPRSMLSGKVLDQLIWGLLRDDRAWVHN